jgi:predicted HicB family RNase H-like nuclease
MEEKDYKQIAIRVAPELHKLIKTTVIQNDTSIQSYIIDLVLADFKKKNIKVGEV